MKSLLHFASVVFGYDYHPRPLICPRGHVRHWLSPWDARFYARHGFTRCWRDYQPMRPKPHPSDTDLRTGVR